MSEKRRGVVSESERVFSLRLWRCIFLRLVLIPISRSTWCNHVSCWFWSLSLSLWELYHDAWHHEVRRQQQHNRHPPLLVRGESSVLVSSSTRSCCLTACCWVPQDAYTFDKKTRLCRILPFIHSFVHSSCRVQLQPPSGALSLSRSLFSGKEFSNRRPFRLRRRRRCLCHLDAGTNLVQHACWVPFTMTLKATMYKTTTITRMTTTTMKTNSCWWTIATGEPFERICPSRSKVKRKSQRV